MRRFVVFGVLLLSVASINFCAAQSCGVADPTNALKGVNGDSEFSVDPDDPNGNFIYISNIDDGLSPIVAAHIDGKDGRIVPGSVTTIANNFRGLTRINGPEFVHPPGMGLGILYRAEDGVHGIFRPSSPTAWNDFHFDVDGQRVGKDPPRLASSYRGSYEGGGMPFDQYTYTLFLGPCTDRCFASVRAGFPTDVSAVLSLQGLAVVKNWLTQGVEDATVLVKACARQGAKTGSCGIYEAKIDGDGGLVQNSVAELAALPPDVGPLVESRGVPMAAARDPVTKTNVLFIAAAHEAGKSVDVYQQTSAHEPFKLVGSVPVTSSEHYRIISNGQLLFLHYIIFDGNAKGSYSVVVRAVNGRLEVGQSKLISTEAAGAEVDYLPAAQSFVIFYVAAAPPHLLQRCLFNP